MRKLWDKIVALLLRVPIDKWLHFIAGMVVAAVCVITFGWPGWVGFLAAVVAGLAKEAFDWYTTKVVEWKDGVATAIGGLVILVLWLLGLLV